MSDAEPLFALLEVMLRTFAPPVPKVKPGGHEEEIFVDLTEEEKEEFGCSICYQILKDTRQCMNKHKFCYSCIFVWSNSGNPINHSRCPVCRTHGLYIQDSELDEKIGRKRVTCALKSCKWSGPLKLLGSHQHLTYPVGRRTITPHTGEDDESVSELPQLRPRSRLDPSPVSMSTPNSILAPGRRSIDVSEVAQHTGGANTPHINNNNNNSNSLSSPNTPRSTSNPNQHRARSNSRHRHTSVSPSRRQNATGLNSRLTNRGRIQNTGETAPQQTRVPRPPPGPRPQGRTPRRIPTLPSIVHSDSPSDNANSSSNSTAEINTANRSSDTNNNNSINNNNSTTSNASSNSSNIISVDASPVSTDVPFTMPERRRYATETAQAQRTSTSTSTSRQGFTLIRDRLNESRHRLDALMGAFTVELDRGRQDLTDFQEERERRRQEQLEEVRELGRRLGHVATELRGLLTQRRSIRDQIDRLVSSDSD